MVETPDSSSDPSESSNVVGRWKESAGTGFLSGLLTSGILYFVSGLALFALLMFRDFTNNSLVFLAAIVSVALIFYGTGSQAALTFDANQGDAARLNLWIGGGAAVLALAFGQFIIQNEMPIRSVFRVNTVPVIVDVEYCVLSDPDCFGIEPFGATAEAEFANLDQREFAAVADAVSVWGDRDRSFFQDVSIGERVRRRYLVFTDHRIEFRLERDVSKMYEIAQRIIFDLPIAAAKAHNPPPKPGCLQKALPTGELCAFFYVRVDPNHLVEGSYSLRLAIIPKSFISSAKNTFTATPPAEGTSKAARRRIEYVVE